MRDSMVGISSQFFLGGIHETPENIALFQKFLGRKNLPIESLPEDLPSLFMWAFTFYQGEIHLIGFNFPNAIPDETFDRSDIKSWNRRFKFVFVTFYNGKTYKLNTKDSADMIRRRTKHIFEVAYFGYPIHPDMLHSKEDGSNENQVPSDK